jgi:polar amino acid transport system substrate-binding protein
MANTIRKARMVADPYPPYQYEEEGEVRGIDHEIVVAAFAVHGIATQTLLLPWADCLDRVQRGQADGIFQILPTPERQKLFLFSARLRTENTLVLRMKSRSQAWAAEADSFRGRRLGILEGYSYGPAVDGLGESEKLGRKSQRELLEALVAGEVDLILMDAGVAAYLTDKLGISGTEAVPGFSIQRPLHVAFRRACAELSREFDSGFAAVRERGLYERILSSYGLSSQYS